MAKQASLRSKLSKDALGKRVEESYNRKDDSGRFHKIWKEDAELKFWKCDEGDHVIDIIPFLAGSQHPQEEEGEATYLVDLWVHYGIGVGEDSFVCPARNYDERCPVCEYVNQLRKADEPDEERIKQLLPRRRAIYNIICYDNSKEEDKGLQVWDASHYLTEKNFLALARNPRGGGFTAFADPDEGMSIAFTREGKGMTNTKYLGFKFVERGYAISDEDLENAPILDEMYNIPTYDELREVFMLGESSYEDEEPAYTGTGEDVPVNFPEEGEINEGIEEEASELDAGGDYAEEAEELDEPPAPTTRKRTVRTAAAESPAPGGRTTGRTLRPTRRRT